MLTCCQGEELSCLCELPVAWAKPFLPGISFLPAGLPFHSLC